MDHTACGMLTTPVSIPHLSGAVLVVEDSDLVCDVTARMCERIGLSPVQAYNGLDGLEAFQSRQDYALILLDLSLPGMNGYELLEKIRELNAKVPVLIISGYDAWYVHEKHGVVFNGATAFLQKPFSLATLARRVQELVGSSA